MLKWLFPILLALTVQAVAQDTIPIVIQTNLGDIVVELDARRAPRTTANFLRYVDAAILDNGSFYRTVTLKPDNQPGKKVKIEVIQGGLDPAKASRGFKPIKLERTSKTGLKHRDGTISMARDGPDTATAEFFICVGDQPELDYGGKRNPDGQGFAAFGRVVSGQDVVKKIHRSRAQGQTLEPAIVIQAVRRR